MTFSVAFRLLAVMAFWTACFPLITIGLDLVPHLMFAAMRAALAGFVLLAVGAFLHRPFPRSRGTWGLIVLVGLGSTALGFLGMFHAAEFISPGIATVIANTQPVLAAGLAYAMLGERLMTTAKIGLIVGFLGIVAIAWPGLISGNARGYGLGSTYILLAVAGVAVGNVAMKRLPSDVDAIMAVALQLLVGAIPLALASILSDDLATVVLSSEFVVILVLLSVFGTSLAFWLWFTALQQVSLTSANAFTFLVPLFALAIGWAFFREELGAIQVAGVALVMLGTVLVQCKAKTAAPPA